MELKDLGLAENYLEVRCQFDATHGCQLDQESTILELLHKHGLGQDNAVLCLMGEEGSDEDQADLGALLPSTGPGSPKHPTIKTFQSLLGSL